MDKRTESVEEWFTKIESDSSKDYQISYQIDRAVKLILEKNHFPEENKEFLKSVNRPYTQASFFFVEWKTKHEMKDALEAKKLLTKSINEALENKWYNILVSSIKQNFELLKDIDRKKIDVKDLLKRSYNILIEPGEMKFSDKLDLVRLIIENSYGILEDKEVIDILTGILSWLNEKIEETRKTNIIHSEITLIEEAIKIYTLLKNEGKIMELKKRCVDSTEAYADFINDPLISSSFYQDALKKSQEIGYKEKFEPLKEKLIKSSKGIQWKKFEVKGDISDIINAFKDEYKKYDKKDLLNKLSKDERIFINQKELDSCMAKPESGLFDLIKKTMYDSDGLLITTDETKMKEARCIRQYEAIQLPIRNVITEFIFSSLDIEEICEFINKKNIVNGNTLKFIKEGLDKIKNTDYVSASHILIVQIEPVLKDILRQKSGITAIKFTSTGLQEYSLGTILRKNVTQLGEIDSKIDECLGQGFRKFLEFKLIMNEGDNLRDLISHGKLKYENFSKVLALDLFYIILKLVNL